MAARVLCSRCQADAASPVFCWGNEVGHYLGLSHATTMTNMMGADVNDDGIGEIDENSTAITASQGTIMRRHCSISGPC